MRVEYWVEPKGAGWGVRCGRRPMNDFADQTGALHAARTWAQAVASRGEVGVVRLVGGGGDAQVETFRPDLF